MDVVKLDEFENSEYSIEDIYNLPEGQHAELIDGELYMMAAPSTKHQRLVTEFTYLIKDYIKRNNGECEIFPSPFAVFLNADNEIYLEPDISVICDKSKLEDKGCNGAPDWIVEVISPSTQRMDYSIKLFKYRTAGVREYWIVNPITKTVQIYSFDGEEDSSQFSFDDEISVHIFDGLTIKISDLL